MSYSPQSRNRARALLQANIPEAAFNDYQEDGSFSVYGSATGARYIVYAGLVILPGVCSFCVSARPSEDFPLADSSLTLALYIQHDERRFLRIANPRMYSNPYRYSRRKLHLHYLRALAAPGPLTALFASIALLPFALLTLFFDSAWLFLLVNGGNVAVLSYWLLYYRNLRRRARQRQRGEP